VSSFFDVNFPEQAIEGKRIIGQSRDPLRASGIDDDTGCFTWIASFDVKAYVDVELSAEEQQNMIIPTAETRRLSRVVCKKARIYSRKKKRPSNAGVAPGSATHKTNHWTFSRQTAVKIIFGHNEIMNTRLPLLRLEELGSKD
jgi:hypothetical protein